MATRLKKQFTIGENEVVSFEIDISNQEQVKKMQELAEKERQYLASLGKQGDNADASTATQEATQETTEEQTGTTDEKQETTEQGDIVEQASSISEKEARKEARKEKRRNRKNK